VVKGSSACVQPHFPFVPHNVVISVAVSLLVLGVAMEILPAFWLPLDQHIGLWLPLFVEGSTVNSSEPVSRDLVSLCSSD
jgi:hypothetical protein